MTSLMNLAAGGAGGISPPLLQIGAVLIGGGDRDFIDFGLLLGLGIFFLLGGIASLAFTREGGSPREFIITGMMAPALITGAVRGLDEAGDLEGTEIGRIESRISAPQLGSILEPLLFGTAMAAELTFQNDTVEEPGTPLLINLTSPGFSRSAREDVVITISSADTDLDFEQEVKLTEPTTFLTIPDEIESLNIGSGNLLNVVEIPRSNSGTVLNIELERFRTSTLLWILGGKRETTYELNTTILELADFHSDLNPSIAPFQGIWLLDEWDREAPFGTIMWDGRQDISGHMEIVGSVTDSEITGTLYLTIDYEYQVTQTLTIEIEENGIVARGTIIRDETPQDWLPDTLTLKFSDDGDVLEGFVDDGQPGLETRTRFSYQSVEEY